MRPRGILAAALWTIAIGGLGSGCIDIEGGAVEFSWSLRSFDGDAVESCGDAKIEKVRLCWQPLGDGSIEDGNQPCLAGQRSAFDCGDSSGVTGFKLPPGRTAFWIEPLCAAEEPADPDTYEVPPPIVRRVYEGQIVSLNALLIVVTPLPDCGPNEQERCTCSEP